jgi:phosphatidyl-myo-inositol dimannoside synthase
MGGMETYCLRLTEELSKTHSLQLNVLPGKTDGRPPSILSLALFGCATVVRLMFSRETKIVHIGDMACWPFAAIAKLRHPRSKVVLSAHGSDLTFADRAGLLGKLYKAYLSAAAYCVGNSPVIANSNWIAQKAITAGFSDVSVVPLATDIKRPQGRDEISDPFIFFAGRIAAGKGLGFFIDNVLPKLAQPITLKVAGKVWDYAEAKKLECPYVEYLGLLTPEELASHYERAVCTIVPSQFSEGFGLVAAEAAACEGIVVASDHSGLREAAGEGVGILVEADNADSWLQTIDDISSWTAKRRAAFIARSSATAKQRFSWERVAADTVKIYNS